MQMDSRTGSRAHTCARLRTPPSPGVIHQRGGRFGTLPAVLFFLFKKDSPCTEREREREIALAFVSTKRKREKRHAHTAPIFLSLGGA